MSVVKKMSGVFAMAAFVAMTTAAGVSCGGDDNEGGGDTDAGGGDAGGGNAGGGGTCEGTRPARNLTLIQVLGSTANDFVATPHKIEVIDGDGKALNPPITAMSDTSGKFTISGVPCEQKNAWIHVTGSGTTKDDTYDSLSLSAPDSQDNLIRISLVGTVATAESTGGFKSDPTKVAIGGAVYRVDDTGKRVGTIGCAQIYMDGDAHPKEGVDQRYVQGVLPTTWEMRQKTERTGKFYFGNVDKGEHTFKVSVDGGKTFLKLRPTEGGDLIDALPVKVPFVRNDASGPYKSFLVLFGIDVPGADPTPADCPPDA